MTAAEKIRAGVRSKWTTVIGAFIAVLTILSEIKDPDFSDVNLYIKLALAAALVIARDGGTSSQESGVRPENSSGRPQGS